MRPAFAAMVLLISASCIVYELVLAQTAAALLGHTLLRYSLTIGIYLAALGCGAFLVRAGNEQTQWRRLLRIEWVLIALGGFAPWLAIASEALLRAVLPPESAIFSSAVSGSVYLLTAGIGVISGLELPLLIQLGESRFREGRVLALDYFGTLAGVALFTYVLLPGFGLFACALVAGAMSCGSAFLILHFQRERTDWVLTIAAAAALILAAVFHAPLSELFIFRLYLGVPS